MGVPSHPCDTKSRWRTISFVQHDTNELLNKNFRVLGSGPFLLEFNGHIRTVVADIKIESAGYDDYEFDPTYNYKLCAHPPELRLNGRLFIELENGSCVKTKNPPINFEGYESYVNYIFNLPGDFLEPIDEWWYGGDEVVFMSRDSLFDDPSFTLNCSAIPPVQDITDGPIFGLLSNGTWLLFDPHLDLDTNTPNLPVSDGGKSTFVASGGRKYCSNVPRTFLNEDDCKLTSNACTQSSSKEINTTYADNGDNMVVVCGSPGEVSNSKADGLLFDAYTGFETVSSIKGYNPKDNKQYVWFMIALEASDQLRQRVTWAFAQLLVIVEREIKRNIAETEGFLYFYDIFVRNAFGNYRDILREVSYSTYMAESLSFLNSKSSAYMLEHYRINASTGKLPQTHYVIKA